MPTADNARSHEGTAPLDDSAVQAIADALMTPHTLNFGSVYVADRLRAEVIRHARCRRSGTPTIGRFAMSVPAADNPRDDRWPLGSSWMFTSEFLRYVHPALIEKREGEFDFGGCTWQVRETITDELGYVTHRCERVL